MFSTPFSFNCACFFVSGAIHSAASISFASAASISFTSCSTRSLFSAGNARFT